MTRCNGIVGEGAEWYDPPGGKAYGKLERSRNTLSDQGYTVQVGLFVYQMIVYTYVSYYAKHNQHL